MQLNRVRTVILAAAIALIALTIFQVTWIQHSRKLIKEDFEQKLKMALCAAMDDYRKDSGEELETTTDVTQKSCAALTILNPEILEDSILHKNLRSTLDYYGIGLSYEIELTENSSSCSTIADPYCCTLSSTIAAGDQMLRISFPEKEKFINGQLGFMLGASILSIALIALAFLWSIYNLLRLKKINQINKDFFNNMAHEFKTPLTNIGLASSMLQKRKKELRENQFLKIVDRENDKLKNQIERVLHLAKMENGQYQLQKEKLNINHLLQQVIEDLAMLIQKHQAQINLQLPSTPLMIEADPFHLSNAFRNLIENALLYSNKHPQLNIEIKKSKAGIQLLFSDNGIGIHKNEQALIFEKFHRVGTGDLHQQKGFGLGLYYVKLVVELHKGIIKMASELNKGSRFDLFLPGSV